MFDGILLDLSGILTIAEVNESLLLKRPTSNFPSLFLMSKSKKLASYSSIFSLPRVVYSVGGRGDSKRQMEKKSKFHNLEI